MSRVRIVAAQALLDRAWGTPKEAQDDDQRQISIDFSGATTAELQALLALVQRGALRPVRNPDETRASIQRERGGGTERKRWHWRAEQQGCGIRDDSHSN